MIAIERAKNVAPAAKRVNCFRDRGEKKEESAVGSAGIAGRFDLSDMLEKVERSTRAMRG